MKLEELKNKIMPLLQHPHSVHELCAKTDYSISWVRDNLKILEADKQVHSFTTESRGTLWLVGLKDENKE